MRLKDDLVQWQLKKSSDTDPVTFGLRCSGPEDAQRVREPVVQWNRVCVHVLYIHI